MMSKLHKASSLPDGPLPSLPPSLPYGRRVLVTDMYPFKPRLVRFQDTSEGGREDEGHHCFIVSVNDEVCGVEGGKEDGEEEEGGVVEDVGGGEVEGAMVQAPTEGKDERRDFFRVQAGFQGDNVLGEGGREGGREEK
jgi:hypothetical protein